VSKAFVSQAALHRAVLLVLTLCAGPCVPAAAQTLYGDKAPPDAAYVRVFRVPSGAGGEQALILGSARFEPQDRASVSPYRPVFPDIYQIRGGGSAAEIIPRAGRYYTIAVTPGEIRVIEDPAHTDPARAQLVLYNLSGRRQVALTTEDKETPLLPPASPGEVERITVNAVPVRLAVFAGGELLQLLGDPGLRRGSSYSAFVFEQPGRAAVLWAEAALALE
jgi:hypothetical protein